MQMISKDGEISKFPGYRSSKEEEEPTSDKEVESDLESTARSKPKSKKLKKTAKAIPDRTFRDCPYCPKNMQLQNIIPQIITQVTANINGGNGDGGNNGCSYKTFTACNLKEFDGKGALTWWNTQVQARGREAVIGMSWNDFKALLVEEFCPSNETEKLENEFWNHTMVGANYVAYTDRFHELAKLVPHLVTLESS
ncbi:reverse transcriptase domain-containing protein [Tanacetum coccineum]